MSCKIRQRLIYFNDDEIEELDSRRRIRLLKSVEVFDKELCLGVQKKIEERMKELEVRELGKEFSCNDASAPP